MNPRIFWDLQRVSGQPWPAGSEISQDAVLQNVYVELQVQQKPPKTPVSTLLAVLAVRTARILRALS